MFKKVLVLAGMFAISGSVSAACSSSDLSGTWYMYFGKDAPGFIKFTIPSNSNTMTNTGFYKPGSSTKTISGSLTVDTTCHVKGRLVANSTDINTVDARISKGKDSMSGMFWNSTTSLGPSFSAIKQ
ncbi:MAG: hypothetical protein EPN89_00135 [Methylovulum sp.]|nr:MAG: hypothetical protein EPN89_00135 [Methylovulum sp.]